jgi:uracil-DNA glycosylase
MNINNINKTWFANLKNEFSEPYFLELDKFLAEQKKSGAVIYPPEDKIFNALNLTDFNNIKVVILGQDPYHGPNQAQGLSFSVQTGLKLPPSLKNIYKELATDIGTKPTVNGNLEPWAKQGVLLLNAVLTVEQANANAHANKGWEQFTDSIIKLVSQKHSNVVFILWGSYAQKKDKLIDESKHLIIKDAHPSPLSAYRGFFGSKPFSKTNNYLIKNNKKPIDWQINNEQLSLF